MDVAIGVVLALLTLYTSTLTFALRSYSRARLTSLLPRAHSRHWIERLDNCESELQAVSGFIRLVSVLITSVWIFVVFLHDQIPQITTSSLWAPGVVVLFALLIFGVGVPHALAMHLGEPILARSLGILWYARIPFWPVERMLMGVETLVRLAIRKPPDCIEDESERVEQEVLDVVSEGAATGAVDEQQTQMIRSVFELSETQVSAIMTPRTEMSVISVDLGLRQAIEEIVRMGHSRVPVYEKSIDNIVGVLYAKDLLGIDPDSRRNIRDLLRGVPFVPETKTIDDLLRELRLERVHIAIVVDEYGGTAGVVTIEDILEELVGEIDDEYDDSEKPRIQRVDESTLIVDARASLYDVCNELEISLPEDGDYETIGGFLFTAMGKIPVRGEEFTHENVHFSVVEAEARRINRLRIHVARPSETAPA